MYISDFFKDVLENQAENDNLKTVENKFFSLSKNAEAQKLICALKDEPLFFDDENFYRLLSLDEILDAEDDMGVSFKKKGILPLIDCEDNDFISYDFKNNNWCKFNVIEETKFKIKQSVLEFFKQN